MHVKSTKNGSFITFGNRVYDSQATFTKDEDREGFRQPNVKFIILAILALLDEHFLIEIALDFLCKGEIRFTQNLGAVVQYGSISWVQETSSVDMIICSVDGKAIVRREGRCGANFPLGWRTGVWS